MIFFSLRRASLATALLLAMPTTQAAGGTQAAAHISSINTQSGDTYDAFIVTYRAGTVDAAMRGLNAVVASSDKPLRITAQRKLATGALWLRTSQKLDAAQANALMARMGDDPAVLYIEPDLRMHAVRDIRTPAGSVALSDWQAFTPDDPLHADYQWHLQSTAGGARIDRAWPLADGHGVVVAVLDTGITRHPDLDTSLGDAGYDFISHALISGRDIDGRVAGGWDTGDWTTGDKYLASNGGCVDAFNPPANSSWHGTHVSGTVAELTDNGLGMAGVAHRSKVLPVRVLGHCGGTTADIADAIVWASGGHVDGVADNPHPAQVINMSLGGQGTCSADSSMGRAITAAIARGTTVVVAAGNSNMDVSLFSPANCPGVIAVAANGVTGRRTFYSNYGSGITLSAPGGGVYPGDGQGGMPVKEGFVWQAINDGETVPANSVYGGMAGTSQASPHVAGTVALMVSAAKEAGLAKPTPQEIASMLTRSARRFPVSIDRPIGAGILDAGAAVNLALGNDPGEPDPEPFILLTPGVLLREQFAYEGDSNLYAIDVPAGARNLNIRTLGGLGDVTLYVDVDKVPADDGSDARYVSDKAGNNEAVVIAQPENARYYIRARAKTEFRGMLIIATYTP
ncbi:S8 family peptidase [Dyella sp.]|uniref:S8 family peptidase n=1 Tax=Dyella sp. TaxID=1869338 RepID=UPI002ED60A12